MNITSNCNMSSYPVRVLFFVTIYCPEFFAPIRVSCALARAHPHSSGASAFLSVPPASKNEGDLFWDYTEGPWFGSPDFKFASNMFFVSEYMLLSRIFHPQIFGVLNFEFHKFQSYEFMLDLSKFSNLNLSTNPYVFQ